ncbi:hypothetical protein T484DRAFT_1905858 [Baffinella frigidus]|nr:hypothetical protein T484DRAFT_1905858 [Cryptophyta sp. CCMP2293]
MVGARLLCRGEGLRWQDGKPPAQRSCQVHAASRAPLQDQRVHRPRFQPLRRPAAAPQASRSAGRRRGTGRRRRSRPEGILRGHHGASRQDQICRAPRLRVHPAQHRHGALPPSRGDGSQPSRGRGRRQQLRRPRAYREAQGQGRQTSRSQ